jgi:hypothetical protein
MLTRRWTEDGMAESSNKKVGLTAVRIPALIAVALLAMLIVGILIYSVA